MDRFQTLQTIISGSTFGSMPENRRKPLAISIIDVFIHYPFILSNNKFISLSLLFGLSAE
jgi:hypothetical protein